jgi:AcrR family transcriptional regulator
MVQVQKDAVRDRIVEAALDQFAAVGYRQTRMADVAAAAGVSTGNIYRYFPDKEALFAAAVPPHLADRLLEILERRIEALGAAADLTAEASDGDDPLLGFWIAHRRETVVLLGGAADSPLAGIRARFIRGMAGPTLDRLAAQEDGSVADGSVGEERRLVVEQIFEHTVTTITAVLSTYHEAAAIRRAMASFRRYQLAGLQALLRG